MSKQNVPQTTGREKRAVLRKGAQSREDGNARKIPGIQSRRLNFRYVIGVMGVGKISNGLIKN
jgi:hypothetical protein